MVVRAVVLLTLACLAVVLADGADTTVPPPVDCTALASENLINCLSFIKNGNTPATPDDGCCSGLTKVLNIAPQCLCQLAAISATFDINITKAAALPKVCSVPGPPQEKCSVPGTAPPAKAPASAVPPAAAKPPSVPSHTPSAPAKPPSSPTPGTNETSQAPAPSTTDSSSTPTSSSSFTGVSVSLIIAGVAAALFTGF
ncbi:hypothetical protein vseg_000347 [Gypsophila vaccaria]